MATISSSSTTVQVNKSISSSPSHQELRFSQIPQPYTQICSARGYEDPLIINVMMHTIKNICKIKDKQRRNYLLIGSDQDCRVTMVTPQKDVTILGWDFKLRVFLVCILRKVKYLFSKW